MHITYDLLIFGFGAIAYISAVYQMVKRQYSPSFFSRGVWFLLGINTLAGVYFGDGSQGSVILATALFLGNASLFITSYWRGSREFGVAEKISLVMLLIGLAIWLLLNDPFALLVVSLVAHFIGGLPTIWRAVKKAESEQAYHWYFFFIASIIAVIASPQKNVESILFPVYFVFFEALILILVNRDRILSFKKID